MDTQLEEVEEILLEHDILDFAPENFQHSKLLPYINEQLSFSISDFSFIYHKTEEEALYILKKCNFVKIFDDTAIYQEEEINCVFIFEESFLNGELLRQIRNLKDVVFNRFYKKNNYKWVFVPELDSKKTFLDYIKDKNIKSFNLRKSNLINNVIYYKESYDLKDKRKNSDYNSSNYNKWKKYSKNGFLPHKGNHNSNYYNNNYHKDYKKRERFNSDGNNKNNNYYFNNYSNNNYNKKENIEVEIGEIKYPLIINYKYSLNYLNNMYIKLKSENFFDNKPNYLVEDNEIINNKPKNIEIISNTSSNNPNKINQKLKNRKEENENRNNLKMKIPKINPLSQMKKIYNKYDAIPQNSLIVK
jgi:hypothetical protein